ncbi:unnamed protein product [Rhizoctonia solani]|uniref:Zn(2)-C6 fungal-type domain-containing protein n=1 Tax=Rhizoctonia solani TaxID=456999 RepID=A0A8H3HNC1_9AGAM|nr:unnamed protein product [Rhizoctonia solani]
MSITFIRSATGCYACKTRHKKCDETKPHCLRCQKSRIECPGYTYVEHPNQSNRRPRTLPGPRSRIGQPRATAREGTTLANTEELNPQAQAPLPDNVNSVTSEASYRALDASEAANAGAIDISNSLTSSSLFSGPVQRASTDFYPSDRLAVNTTNHVLVLPPPNTSNPMTSGQASLFAALLSLGQPQDADQHLQSHLPSSTDLHADPGISLVSDRSVPDTEQQDNVTTHGDDDSEGVVSMICRQPVLDKTAESNALPFVLQGYATWISRMSLEPLRLRANARDFVFSHFGDGEPSRWIIGLLANIGSRMGNELAEASSSPLLSALQSAVRRRLGAVRSHPNATRPELAKALDSALETLTMHFYASPAQEVMIIRYEAAPIFRRLCPEPANTLIDLPSLLQNPLGCLRHYAYIDILFNVVMDIPTIFQYEVPIPNDHHQPALATQGVDILQWRLGIPDQLLLVFAKMSSIRSSGFTIDTETVASLERNIRDLQTFDSSSSDPFLMVMRFVVRECWRQVALVYLYMAVCGDSSATPRVKEVIKRFMKLLNGTKPGRLPDDFLMLPLLIVSPAAQRERDREVVRQRVLGLHRRGRAFRANGHVVYVIEDYWARADAEGRPIVWSDVGVSRSRMLDA